MAEPGGREQGDQRGVAAGDACRQAAESLDLYQISPWREFVANRAFGVRRPVVENHFDVQPAMGRWVEKAALDEVSVTEALRGMDDEVGAIMAG
ncbi:MAG: hypothetical protein QGG58_11210 [Chloroflexota bacterium]|nr:hypothetical protein [Chloroflexota bacterium]